MSDSFETIFGPVIGNGAQATVYGRGDDAVKLYREGYPKANVFAEAFIMANLEQAGFPSPKIHEVLLTNGRYGLRMDRVKGKTLSEELHDPEKCGEAMDRLAELQCRLQKDYDLPWATDIKLRFYSDLLHNEYLSDDLREELLKELGGLPNGGALCHCDFHVYNVFFDGGDATIIDLLQISRGDPAADAACSYVAYCLEDLKLGELYLDRYCRRSGVPAESVERWLRVYAGTLRGQLPEQHTPIVERFIASGR